MPESILLARIGLKRTKGWGSNPMRLKSNSRSKFDAFTGHYSVSRLMNVQQDKLEVAGQEVPSGPEEVGPAVLEVLPDGHVQLPLAAAVLLLLIDLSEAAAPVSVGRRPPAPSTRDHPLHLGPRRPRGQARKQWQLQQRWERSVHAADHGHVCSAYIF